MKSLDQIKAEIEKAESAWKLTIGDAKKAYWEKCQDLYEEKDDIEKALKNLN